MFYLHLQPQPRPQSKESRGAYQLKPQDSSFGAFTEELTMLYTIFMFEPYFDNIPTCVRMN